MQLNIWTDFNFVFFTWCTPLSFPSYNIVLIKLLFCEFLIDRKIKYFEATRGLLPNILWKIKHEFSAILLSSWTQHASFPFHCYRRIPYIYIYTLIFGRVYMNDLGMYSNEFKATCIADTAPIILNTSTFSSMWCHVCSCIVNQNLVSWASPNPEASQKSSPTKQKLIQR